MLKKLLFIAACLCAAAQAWAAEPTRKDAIEIVDRAAKVAEKQGAKALIDAINGGAPEWNRKDLFVFVYDLKATVLANGMSTKLVGKSVLEVPDVEGKFFRKEIVDGAQAKGSGWTEYKFKNPENNKVEHKATYYRKAGDMIILAGVFADAK